MKPVRLAFKSAVFSVSLILAPTYSFSEGEPKEVEGAVVGAVIGSAPDEFGSGKPVREEGMPGRGQILVPGGGGKMEAMGHWDQYDWKVQMPRWGSYEVMLTYGLKMNSLGVQLKMGETRLKTRLRAAKFEEPETVSLGRLYFPKAGEYEFSLYTPPIERLRSVDFQSIHLVPAPEGEEIGQSDDGGLTLLAKDATTWSTNMRYEPKPEKNCLGFWTEVEDWAEWDFKVDTPGKFKMTVFQGCGGGNGGSEVEVVVGDQTLAFKVQDTEGYQDFKPVEVGEIEIAEPGIARLAIKPKKKAKGAIMDIQKVVLEPVK